MGVKEAELSLGSDVMWRGEVAKGCGNQVFEYGTHIPLAPSPSTDPHTGSSPPQQDQTCALSPDADHEICEDNNLAAESPCEDMVAFDEGKMSLVMGDLLVVGLESHILLFL